MNLHGNAPNLWLGLTALIGFPAGMWFGWIAGKACFASRIWAMQNALDEERERTNNLGRLVARMKDEQRAKDGNDERP